MVSVIVPIYNVEEYLAECLYSIANQTYPDIEVLCINDCAMDNSNAIINQFCKIDKRFKLIAHDKNRGLGGARNTGIQNAQGEYLLFVDSDDAIAPDLIEKLVTDIQESNSDVSICAALEFYPDGTWNKNSTFHYRKYMTSFRQPLITQQDRTLLTDMWPSAWNKLFKTEIVRKFNCSFPEKILYEDHAFYYSYFSHVKVFSYVNDTYYYYRKNRPGSITSNATGRENEIFSILSDIESKFKDIYANKADYLKMIMKISYRLLAERNFVLVSNRQEWFSFCKKSRAYLLSKYTIRDLKNSVDTFFDTKDEFYQYIFSNRIRIKINTKEFIKSIPGMKHLIRIVLHRGGASLPASQGERAVKYINDPVLAAAPSYYQYITRTCPNIERNEISLPDLIKRCQYYMGEIERAVNQLLGA